MPEKSILLIEDNPGDVLLVKLVLKSLGYEDILVHFDNGQDALTYLYDVRLLPDFIFLDMNLPGLNGFEVLNIIRNNERLEHIKVMIFTSAHIPDEELLKYPSPDRYFTKPFTFNEYYKQLASSAKSG